MNAPTLITRCDHCQTVFRISAMQLQARGGQVRCGRCLQVFDGLAGLQADVPQADAVQPAASQATESKSTESPPAAAKPAELQSAGSQPDSSLPQIMPEAGATVADDQSLVIESLEIALPEPAQEPTRESGQDEPVIEAQELPLPADAGDVSAQPEAAAAEPVIDEDNPFVPQAPVVEPRRRAWAVASVLLLIVFLGQAAYFYRGEIAARHALAREWVVAACAAAGCNVEMPQRPKSVLIEGSDLQVIDPARPERIQLTATLRNHAGHAVGYPALDLVLTNANDHTLARRIFVPGEYLPRGIDRGAGLAANAEMTVRLALDAGSLGASGFRLAVLAAAQ